MLTESVLIHDAATRERAPLAGAWGDLMRGLRLTELWGTMGWLDVRQRYSRSVMGPFWVTLSLAIFVFGLGITYGSLFGIPLDDYLPYLTIGMVTWTFVASLMNEGCLTFTAAETAIKQMPAPLSIHVFRLLWRSLIIFAHNLVIVVVVMLIFRVAPTWTALLVIPGFALVILNGMSIAITLGLFSARFRDIPPLMANVVQMMFFVTPVLWRAEHLSARQEIVLYNPFYHLIELVRAPLLGIAPPVSSWLIVVAFTAVNFMVALYLFARLRWRIPYWL